MVGAELYLTVSIPNGRCCWTRLSGNSFHYDGSISNRDRVTDDGEPDQMS